MTTIPARDIVYLYRSTLRHLRMLSDLDRRTLLWMEAQRAFREPVADVVKAFEAAELRLAFVRAEIPPRFRPAPFRKTLERQVTVYAPDGSVLDQEATLRNPGRKYAFRELTDEDRKRHYDLVNRFQFGGRNVSIQEEQMHNKARDEYLRRHPGPLNEHGEPMLPDGGIDEV